MGLAAPGPVRTAYADAAASWPERRQRRYQQWLAEPAQIGEVKARQFDRRNGPWQLIDTRRAGPDTPFFPFDDFYVVIIFGLDGDIVMARRLQLSEMVDYVASNVGRGGAWNYKISISADITAGTDLTAAARAAIRQLSVQRSAGPRAGTA